MGPILVHRSVMPSWETIQVQSWVNNEPRQSARWGEMIFSVPEIISCLSRGRSLLSGDIIATGTPAGVGAGMTPQCFLKSGDEVVVEVTGTGRLVTNIL